MKLLSNLASVGILSSWLVVGHTVRKAWPDTDLQSLLLVWSDGKEFVVVGLVAIMIAMLLYEILMGCIRKATARWIVQH